MASSSLAFTHFEHVLAKTDHKREFTNIALDFAILKLKFCILKSGYDQNQPRVPAGNPDGGQWSANGNSSSGRSSNSNAFNGYRLEQDEGRSYARGSARSHTIKRHVGKSKSYLKTRVQSQQKLFKIGGNIPKIGKIVRKLSKIRNFRAGSFTSLAAANRLVRSTLAQNSQLLEDFASGKTARVRVTISKRFSSPTGYEAYSRGLQKPRIRTTFGLTVVLVYDASAPKKYRVLTAFPTR